VSLLIPLVRYGLFLVLGFLVLGILPDSLAQTCAGNECPVSFKSGNFSLKSPNLNLDLRLEEGWLRQLNLSDSQDGRLIANAANWDDGRGAFQLSLLQPGTGQQVELGTADFRFTQARLLGAKEIARNNRRLGSDGPNRTADELVLDGVANWANGPLYIQLTYSFPPDADFVQAQLSLQPTAKADGWVVTNAASVRWRLDPALKPTPRTALLDSALYYQKRWKLPSGATPGNWMVGPNGAGLYSFSNSPFGREYYQDGNLFVVDQYDHQPLSEGFQGGPAVLGYFRAGGSEMGYTRFVNYLTRYVSRMTRQNKQAPVFFNTWIPWTNRIDQNTALEALNRTQQAGYYDVLHLDAGWESTIPLQADTQKFPGGLDYIQDKAHEQNLGLGIWINPYSDSYFGYVNYETFHRSQRDWHVVLTEGPLPKLGFNRGAFQVLSPYSDYVEQKLTDLVSRYDIRMIYWDGADWNIRDAEVDFLDEAARQRNKVLGIKRLMKITEHLYSIRPDLLLVCWNAWIDPHLLSVFDQEQVTDLFTAPLGVAEQTRRKTYYSMSYIMPYATIWSDWYGLTYNERKNDDANLNLPQSQLEYAELSMLSKGLKEAGGTIDPAKSRPELKTFIKNLMAFRKRFDRYFDVYQRVSDAPDGVRPDASGHIIDGKGFLILNNPANYAQQLNLNLNPLVLGLQPGRNYSLYDWSDLKRARTYGNLAISFDGRAAPLSMNLPPRTVRIISLDLNDSSNDKPLPAQGQPGS